MPKTDKSKLDLSKRFHCACVCGGGGGFGVDVLNKIEMIDTCLV